MLIHTPNCIFYTRAGSVPHLTQDVLDTLVQSSDKLALHLALDQFWDLIEPATDFKTAHINKRKRKLSESGQLLNKTAVLDDAAEQPPIVKHQPRHHIPTLHSYISSSNILIMTPRDLFDVTHEAPFPKTARAPNLINSDNTISGQKLNGHVIKIGTLEYMKAILKLNPDICTPLCDFFSTQRADDKINKAKRIRKSVERNLKFLDLSLEQMRDILSTNGHTVVDDRSNNEPRPALFAVCGGYDDPIGREFSAKESAKRNVAGFLIPLNKYSALPVSELLRLTTRHLPAGKPRFVAGLGSFEDVHMAITTGAADLVSLEFLYLHAENGEALIFCPEPSFEAPSTGLVSPSTPSSLTTPVPKTELLSLIDGKYKREFIPLQQGCACFACENHTRSYIHHLLLTKEMLGQVLLSLHNYAGVQRWISSLRVK